MIEAPQSQDAWPVSTETPPPELPKISMMIAAYRAARLNQRLTQRSTPGPLPSEVFPKPAVIDAVPVAVETTTVTQVADPGPFSCEIVAAETFAAPVPEHETVADPPVTLGEAGQPEICATPERPPPLREPALSEIGLGPSMLIRLNQLGLRRVRDVAQASPDDLRAALGGSSRLLNVEAWIANARTLTAAA